jgi:hypothetical protein
MDHSLPLASRLRSFGRQNLKRREIGGYEAAAKMLGHNYYFSSDAVQFVSTGMQQNRKRRMQSYADLQKMDPNSKKVNFRNMIDDYYKNRPKELENESLYTIHEWYEYEKNGSKTERANYFKLHNNLGWLRKRTKPKVIRTANYSTKTDNGVENYYHSLLFLFRPWRDETDLLKDGEDTFLTYKAAFLAVSSKFEDMIKHDVGKRKIEAAKELAKKLEEEAEEQASALADDHEALPLAIDLADLSLLSVLSSEELASKVASLNTDQRAIFKLVSEAIEKQNTGVGKQVKMIISGVAGIAKSVSVNFDHSIFNATLCLGTGKSFLIEVIRDYVRSLPGLPLPLPGSPQPDPVALVAPTGIAAFNICGSTMHRYIANHHSLFICLFITVVLQIFQITRPTWCRTRMVRTRQR